MEILEKLSADIKQSMKNKDAFRLGVLRMMKTDAKNKEIELRQPLSDADFLTVVTKMVRQRKDSIEQYQKAERVDLADKEKQEIEILNEFLPQPLSEEEVVSIIQAAIEKTGASDMKQMGLIMKEVKDQTTGRVDGKLLADKVKAALA
jgi:uncharacterized protein